MEGAEDGQPATAESAINGEKQAGTHQPANHSQDVMVH